jgi:hypothetical protein
MAVLVVVPREEHLAEAASILDTAKSVWKLGPVFKGLELSFRVGIVITGVRSA